MKLIHTADWHLGNIFHGHNREAEFQHMTDWLLDLIDQEAPDAVLIAGDIFDSSNPSAQAEALYYDFLLQATSRQPGLQVVCIAGNHDSAGRIEAPAELLKRHNVYVRGKMHQKEDADEPDYAFHLLPLSRRGEEEACCVVVAAPYLRPHDIPGSTTAEQALTTFFQQAAKSLRKSPFKNLPCISVAHYYASRADIAQGEHSERLVVGGQDRIDADVAGQGAVYAALGHIHKAQRVADHTYYAGSLLPLSFSEKGYRRGAYIVEIDEQHGDISVQQATYEPLRALISIPEQGYATTAEALDAIRALPERKKHDEEGRAWPYLEIRISEQQPEPEFPAEATRLLEDKAVRFCRIVRQLTEQEVARGQGELPERVNPFTPEDLLRETFQQRYSQEPSEAILQRFAIALEAAQSEQGDTEGRNQ